MKPVKFQWLAKVCHTLASTYYRVTKKGYYWRSWYTYDKEGDCIRHTVCSSEHYYFMHPHNEGAYHYSAYWPWVHTETVPYEGF